MTKIKIISQYSCEELMDDVNEFLESLISEEIISIKMSEGKDNWTVLIHYHAS